MRRRNSSGVVMSGEAAGEHPGRGRGRGRGVDRTRSGVSPRLHSACVLLAPAAHMGTGHMRATPARQPAGRQGNPPSRVDQNRGAWLWLIVVALLFLEFYVGHQLRAFRFENVLIPSELFRDEIGSVGHCQPDARGIKPHDRFKF